MVLLAQRVQLQRNKENKQPVSCQVQLNICTHIVHLKFTVSPKGAYFHKGGMYVLHNLVRHTDSQLGQLTQIEIPSTTIYYTV